MQTVQSASVASGRHHLIRGQRSEAHCDGPFNAIQELNRRILCFSGKTTVVLNGQKLRNEMREAKLLAHVCSKMAVCDSYYAEWYFLLYSRAAKALAQRLAARGEQLPVWQQLPQKFVRENFWAST